MAIFEMNNNKQVGDGESLKGPELSNTKSPEDECRTEEVLKDLGLHGNNSFSGMKEVYESGLPNQDIESLNLGNMERSIGPNIPPSFGSLNESKGPDLVGTIVPYSLSYNDEESHGSTDEVLEHDDFVEAIETWNLGKALRMSSNKDEAIIQDLMEDLVERRKGKKRRSKASQKKKN